MKKIFASIFIVIAGCVIVQAQTNTFPANGAVGIGTTSPNASALLEIKSTSKGLLMPRMANAQRDAIASPATGLLIYQTNAAPGFYYYDGSTWKALAPSVNTAGKWLLTGNAGTTAADYLGTSDNKSLNIKTSNAQRIVINGSGNIGIGTSAPGSLLEVHNGSLTIANNNLTANNSASVILNANTDVNGRSNQILYNDKTTTRWALGGGNIGIAGTTDFGLLNYTAGVNGFTVSSVNNYVGIGTAAPTNKLHMATGSAGVTAYEAAALVVENSSHSFINLLAPDAYETGLCFGKPQGSTNGDILYNAVNSNDNNVPNGFQLMTNGGKIQMVLTADGHLGLGTTDPGVYTLRIKSDPDHGSIDIKDVGIRGLSDDWNLKIHPLPGGGGLYLLELIADGVYVGSFDNFTGDYFGISDTRLKENIQPMKNMLEKINQLKPYTYQYKNAISKQEYNGFIAQDVMKIFPDLVMHTISDAPKTDAYSLNYNGFGVIAIKGIRELLTIYTEQNEKLTLLKKKADELEKAIAKLQVNKKHASASN